VKTLGNLLAQDFVCKTKSPRHLISGFPWTEREKCTLETSLQEQMVQNLHL